ncbi:NAD(P)-binding protein, partial [Pseudomonas aeruginosa]
MKPTAFLALSALACGIAQAAAAPDPALVRQGEYLARAGDCVACHTARDGKPFAGGLPMETPIGAVYSTNITPDRKTGIGDYSFEDFDRAVRHGVARSGDTLYPAMPYPSYARVSEADMRALYAYFMHGVEPVEQPNKASDIPWPLSMRWPLAFWRWTFAPEVKDFQAAAGFRRSRNLMPVEHLDVLIVGAGLSGVGAAYHLMKHCPGKSFALLEGRAAMGGTWDLFRYPGIRSDSDMFTLGYNFKP